MATANTSDVVDVIESQHNEVKSLLTRVASGDGEELRTAFDELRRLLAVHETAEEEIVYPALRSTGAEGERIAKARQNEEAEGITVLSKLEGMDVGGGEFRQTFEEFRKAVLEHATNEENEVLPLLRSGFSADKRRKMADAFELAEKAAPTHPHPQTGTSATAKVITGPALALMDRVRDALRK